MDAVTCPTCTRIVLAPVLGQPLAEPVPGDRSICIYCLAVMVFTAGDVRRQTEAEEIEGLFDRQLHEARAAASAIRGQM